MSTPSKAFMAAIAQQGNGLLRISQVMGAGNPLAGFAHSSEDRTSVVLDINGIRMAVGHNPVVVKGSFFLPLLKNSIEVKTVVEGVEKITSRRPTFEDREAAITAPAVSFLTKFEDEDVPSQELYLIMRRNCGTDGIERPTYTLVLSTGEEAEPIVLPLDLWVYQDGTNAFEAALNGFSGNSAAGRWSNRVRLDNNATNKNNLKQVIGWISEGLTLAGVKMEASTSAVYASRQAHIQDRDASRSGARQQAQQRVMVGAPASGGPSAGPADPFSDAEGSVAY